MDPVAAGPRAHAEEDVADAVRRGPDEVGFLEQTDAHGVDQRVAGVPRREADLAAQRRHSDAVAVVAYPAHHAGEQVSVARMIERAEAETVEHRYRPGAHGEDIAEDAPDAGGGALVRLDRRRVVVGLDLERHGPAIGQPEYAGVLARSLNDLGTGGGECPEHGLGVLVAAVLGPESGEDPQLRQGRGAAQHLDDPAELQLTQIVLAHHLGRDRALAREAGGLGRSRHHGAGHGCRRMVPRKLANASVNTRVSRAGRSSCAISSTSPASSHIPPQCGQLSICTA